MRPLASGFNPRSISGLALWLDASNTGSLFQDTSAATPATVSPNPIGHWKDLSGNGKNATQGTANDRPIISASTRNGRRVIEFDGLGDHFSFTSTSFQTVFGVCFVKSDTVGGRVLNSLIGSTANDIRRDGVSPTTAWRGLGAETNSGDFTNPAGSQFRVNGNSTSIVAEQVWHLVTAIRGTGTAAMEKIGQTVGFREFGGQMAEIICYDRALTTAERDRVERALGQKWGLTIG